MSIRLITFDLDNTLWPVDAVIIRAERLVHDWMTEHHPDVARDWTPERVRALRDELLRDNDTLQHNLTTLRQLAFSTCFERCGYREREARRLALEAFAIFHQARNEVTLFPEARDILERLGRDYRLGALTNGNADLRRIGLDGLFEFHHSAESIGRRKPEPDMFHAALRSAGVQAREAVHVGDHPEEDIDAARRHGFGAIWANLLSLEWPAHLPEPEHRVGSWRELPDVVTRIDRV